MKKNKFRVLALVLMLALIFSGCAAPAAPAPVEEAPAQTEAAQEAKTEAPAKEKIVIGHLGSTSSGYAYTAVAKGFFEEQGLEVELERFKSGSEMMTPLSLGQLDVGSGEAGTALMNAVNSGLDVRAIMSSGFLREGNDYLHLVARKELLDSGEVKTVADLKGRKVAINNVRGQVEYLLSDVLEQQGLTLDDVETVVLPFPEMGAALANGAVDAAFIHYPAAAKVLAPGENGEAPIAEVLVPGHALTEEPYGGMLFFGKRLIAPENHDLAVRVAIAYLKAFRYLSDESWREDQELLKVISEYTEQPPEVVANSVLPYYAPEPWVEPGWIEAMQDFVIARGYTEYTEPVAIEKFLDQSILEDALKDLQD